MLRLVPPATCIALGLVPVLAWLAMAALGWGADAQVLSGTLAVDDPTAAAIRGVWVLGARIVAWVVSPPLIGGGLVWWGWSARAERSDAHLHGSTSQVSA